MFKSLLIYIYLATQLLIFMGLLIVTLFVQNDLRGVVMAKEHGDQFKNTQIQNFSDLYRCSVIVDGQSNLNSILGFLVLLSIIIVIMLLVSIGIKFNAIRAALLFVMFLFLCVPMWVFISKLQTKNRVKVTDNFRDYECITFSSKEAKNYVVGTIYVAWVFVCIQALVMGNALASYL